MITTPAGPKFVKNNDQSGAKSGDHTQTGSLALGAGLAGLGGSAAVRARARDHGGDGPWSGSPGPWTRWW